jgi:hypothetical protein
MKIARERRNSIREYGRCEIPDWSLDNPRRGPPY